MPGSSAKSPEIVLGEYRKNKKFPRPLPALIRLVYAIISEENDPVSTVKTIEAIENSFIDWNECRVARWVEIARAMDPLPGSDRFAMRIKDMLNRLFDRKGMLSLDFCSELKVTEARKFINELDFNLDKQEVSFVLYYFHPGMTLPVSPEGLAVAKSKGLIPARGDKTHLQKVFGKIEHQDAIELLHYLEIDAVAATAPKSSAASTSKKTSKKTTKKAAKKAAKKTSKKKTSKKV